MSIIFKKCLPEISAISKDVPKMILGIQKTLNGEVHRLVKKKKLS